MNTEAVTRMPRFVAARTGELFSMGDHRAHIILSATDTAGDFLLADAEVDPGGGPPLHLHTREDETFIIQAGRFVFNICDKTIEAGPGDTVFAPRDMPHVWRCISKEPGRMLVIVTPGTNFEGFLRGVAEQQIATSSPQDVARLLTLAHKYGQKILASK